MSLEYPDDNELIYQARAVAKDIVNAKYEVTQKVGNFLFLAHSDEEFYQRALAVDPIIESTSSRRLASVSDSKAKLVKALFQEWETKHASCDECDPVNFSLPERVAFPVHPKDESSRKLWNKWSVIRKKRDGSEGFERHNLFDDNNPKTGKPYTAFEQQQLKIGLLDRAIGESVGRLDDPEVRKQLRPNSAVWIDAGGLYGPDKKRVSNKLKGRKPDSDTNVIDPSEVRLMAGTVLGIPSQGENGVFLTHHKCTGNTFRGFKMGENSFAPCQHEHHEGDGCGLTAEAGAQEGSMQPGCGQHHALVNVNTPSIISATGHDGVTRFGAVPHIEDEQPRDFSGLTPSARQQAINRARTSPEAESANYTMPTEEQTGEIPLHRMFLMHPDQSARWAAAKDAAHVQSGGEGRHPANLESFTIGGKTHRLGDIVSTVRRWGSAEPRTEENLGVVVGVSSHKNGQHVRLGRSEGRTNINDSDTSINDATPGEYSVLIHRLDSPTTGGKKFAPTAVDPDTNSILGDSVNETTQYYPSSNINTVEPFNAKKLKGETGSIASKLYSRLKGLQSTFKANPAPVKAEQPKTVKPTRDNLDLSSLDLSDLFGDSE